MDNHDRSHHRDHTMSRQKVVDHLVATIPTLAFTGGIHRPRCRVGVTSDHQAAVLMIGCMKAGYDLAGVDALIAALTQARTTLADAAHQREDHTDAPQRSTPC